MNWQEINSAIQQEIAEATKDLTGKEKDAATATVLNNLSSDVRTFLFNGGHKAATATGSEKIRELESERDTLKTRAETAETRLAELEEKTPDVAKIREQYEADIRTLKETHKSEKDAWETEKTAGKKESFRARFIAAATEKLDPIYVELQALKLDSRIQVAKDGSLSVLQPGKEIPYPADSSDALLSTLVDELVSTAPADRKRSSADSGSGSTGGKGSPSSSSWDKYRARGKEIETKSGNKGVDPDRKEKVFAGM